MSEFELLSPDWEVSSNVVALVTTRKTGRSSGAFSRANFADHVGDSTARVAENRQMLAEQLAENLRWQWLNQVHGSKAVAIDEPITPLAADGLITKVPGIVCCVLTADCLPIFIAANDGSEVAIVHAGWRSLAAGIVENTLVEMSVAPRQVSVWLGPAIGPCHFEVGMEVLEAFSKYPHLTAATEKSSAASNSSIAKWAVDTKACFQKSSASKFKADLYSLARLRLTRLGIANISGGDYCSFCEEDKFYSFRREKVTGRMLSLIYLKK